MEELANLPRQAFITYRTREEGVRQDNWEGIRLDHWLRDRNYRDWISIRFESDDRYMVSFEKVAFDTTACWLAMIHNGEELPPDGFMVIFPHLTQNHWLRNLNRIVLEDFIPIKLPKRIYPMQNLLEEMTLIDNPEPFVDIQGYRFEELMSQLRGGRSADVVFYSEDGYKLRLEYPLHLRGAVLAPRENGRLELKSPQIPGGMWLKDIIYIQIDKRAVLENDCLRRLIDLDEVLDWNLGPGATVKEWMERGSRRLGFAAFVGELNLSNRSRYFRLYPTK